MTQVQSRPVAYAQMENPFGYAFFNDGRDEPAPPSEPPVQGRPLLSDSDMSLNNRLFSGLADPHIVESLNQYQTEPIPNLYGSSSHFGHPETDHISRTLGMFQQGNGFNPPLSAPAHTSVFPGHQAPQGFEFDPALPMLHQRTQSVSFAKPPDQAAPVKGNAALRGVLARRASNEVAPPFTMGGETYNHTAREMLKEGRDARPDSYLERRMTYTYGSDTGFKGNNYTPPETLRKQHRQLEQQKINVVHNGYKAPLRRGSQVQPAGGLEDQPMSARSTALESIPDEMEPHEGGGFTRKRPRHDDDDADDAEAEGASLLANRNKKTKPSISTNFAGGAHDPRSPSGAIRTPASAGGLIRKPSDAGGPSKPTRVNLTEEEKKMNHIRSEQKRRNQIKEGFADLTELMPDASSSGPSKCTVLAKAVEWLTDLIEGNKELKKQLEQSQSTATSLETVK